MPMSSYTVYALFLCKVIVRLEFKDPKKPFLPWRVEIKDGIENYICSMPEPVAVGGLRSRIDLILHI